jgi:hypothetical protein
MNLVVFYPAYSQIPALVKVMAEDVMRVIGSEGSVRRV